MRVKVKFFAMLRELVGVGEEEYEVESGTTVHDLLLKHVPQKHRNISDLWAKKVSDLLHERHGIYMIIVNGYRVDLSQELKDGDVVAILPPVGGG